MSRRFPDAHALPDEIEGLFGRERYDEAIARCEELAERFANVDEPLAREQVAWALVRKGLCLGKLGRAEEAISAYDDLIARYDSNLTGAEILPHVAWAYNNKAFRLKELGRREQAIAAYEELISRFGAASDPGIRLRVSWALRNKARLLEELSRRSWRRSLQHVDLAGVLSRLLRRHFLQRDAVSRCAYPAQPPPRGRHQPLAPGPGRGTSPVAHRGLKDGPGRE